MSISDGKDRSVAEQVARMFLEIGVVKLNHAGALPPGPPAGKSPIYCDGRISLSYPPVRSYIKEALATVIGQRFAEADTVAGVATAGIPQGVLVADQLNLPFMYVRSSPKAHGMSNLVEGEVVKEQKVVVVEDLVSTGGSSVKGHCGPGTHGPQRDRTGIGFHLRL